MLKVVKEGRYPKKERQRRLIELCITQKEHAQEFCLKRQ
jgi:hypothetical protein